MVAQTDGFVGRLRELSTLRDALDDVVAGRGRIVMLAGEPGIGKTRTGQELADHAEGRGAVVLWGRCGEQTGAPPYWPWVQVIRTALRDDRATALLRELGATAGDMADIVPEIREHLVDLDISARLEDGAEARWRMFESIRRFLAGLCISRPIILLLDDLHWADAPSLRLLEFLAPEIAQSRILLVGTYRPTELSRQHPLSNTLGELARAPRVQRLTLAGLSADEAYEFVAAATGARPPPALASALHTQTEGNPLFLREIVRFLEQQGVLGAERSHILPPAIRIPEGVREVIGRRLNLLSERCNDVLALAAVIGREFSDDVLMQAAEQHDEAGLTDALDEALAAHIIQETDDGRYQFAHNLIRMTLYDELRPARRRRLHRSVGEAIELARRADIDPLLPELARHFLAAGDPERAIDYATRAGQRAEALLAFEDAAQSFQMALDMAEQRAIADDRMRCRLLMQLSEAQRKANAFDHALETLRAAAEIATILGDSEICARAALAYEQVAWRSAQRAQPPPRHMLERALGQLSETHAALRTQLVAALARALVHEGAPAEAKLHGERAMTMARELGDPGVLATCLYSLGDVFGGGASLESVQYASDAIATAERVGYLEMIYSGHQWRLISLMERGEIERAKAEVEALTSLSEQIRQRTYVVATLFDRHMLAVMRGELVEAERLIVQSMALVRRGGMPSHEDQLSVLIFTLRREQGRLAELRPVVSAFLQERSAASAWRPALALVQLEVGQIDAARATFEQIAKDGFATIPRDGRWPFCMVFLSEVCAALGDPVRAEALYELVLSYAGRNMVCGTFVFCGSADRYLGLLCAAMSNWAIAERHFTTALAQNTRIGAWLPLAHTQHDFAAMLLARGAAGDRQRAAALLGECLESARRFGMRGLEESSARLSGGVSNDDLTSRELDVLKLLAIGRSNADIALVLEISLNTVATHVRNILAKTGCGNRTEAAAYAMRHGLARPHH